MKPLITNKDLLLSVSCLWIGKREKRDKTQQKTTTAAFNIKKKNKEGST